MSEGVRVVRGPDWKWGNQDEGEGTTGTAVMKYRTDEWLEVIWDYGRKSTYRAGDEDSYDLRIYDWSLSGVEHKAVCDGCKESPIKGMRWKCSVCTNCDLCTTCYMKDQHDVKHAFLRHLTENSKQERMPPRSDSKKINATGMFPGATVIRGPNWKWGNQDGGSGNTGILIAFDKAHVGWASVKWTNGDERKYRLGAEGEVDVQYQKSASGGTYYPDHLPVLKAKMEGIKSPDLSDTFASVLRPAIVNASESKNKTTIISAPTSQKVLPRNLQTGQCHYLERCSLFLKTLQYPDPLFETKYNRCFCLECHRKRGDKEVYTRGEPPETYAMPIGWTRFSLRLPPRALGLNVMEKWHVAYHGTRLENVKNILDTGDILRTGQWDMHGNLIAPPKGHFTEDNKPDAFDIEQVFVSPSIKYAGCPVYAKPHIFNDLQTQQKGTAYVAFEVRILPNSYTVAPETIGARGKRVDENFDNNTLEWSTKNAGALILSGLMFKLE